MPRPLRLTLEFLSYDGTSTNDPADAQKMKKTIEEADVTEVSRQQITIPDSTVDATIALPDANTDYLILSTDQEISVKLNGSGTAITLKPKTASKKAPAMMVRGDITGLLLSNASGSTANVDIIAVNI